MSRCKHDSENRSRDDIQSARWILLWSEQIKIAGMIRMAKTHKTVIGEIKDICERFDHTIHDDEVYTLEQIQAIVNKQLGYAFTV